MRKKVLKPGQKAQKSLYLDASLWDKIEAKAAKERRSTNNLLEIVIEREFLKA